MKKKSSTNCRMFALSFLIFRRLKIWNESANVLQLVLLFFFFSYVIKDGNYWAFHIHHVFLGKENYPTCWILLMSVLQCEIKNTTCCFRLLKLFSPWCGPNFKRKVIYNFSSVTLWHLGRKRKTCLKNCEEHVSNFPKSTIICNSNSSCECFVATKDLAFWRKKSFC